MLLIKFCFVLYISRLSSAPTSLSYYELFKLQFSSVTSLNKQETMTHFLDHMEFIHLKNKFQFYLSDMSKLNFGKQLKTDTITSLWHNQCHIQHKITHFKSDTFFLRNNFLLTMYYRWLTFWIDCKIWRKWDIITMFSEGLLCSRC